MKILVTGGAGFIGSAVIRSIINETDYCCVNLDKLTYAGNLDSLAGFSDALRYSHEQIDICDGQERRKGGPVSRRSSDTHKLIRYQRNGIARLSRAIRQV